MNEYSAGFRSREATAQLPVEITLRIHIMLDHDFLL